MTERNVFAFEVVVGQVITDVSAGRSDMIISGHFEFGIEGSKPAFGECDVACWSWLM